MVLGSPLTGANTANGTATMAQQGSRLSQMQDSFRKQMLRDKEKAKVSPTAPRTSPATTRQSNGPTTPTRQANALPKTPTKVPEEERKPLRQTQRREATPPQSAPRPRASANDENATTRKVTSPAKQQTSVNNAAKPRTSPKSTTASISPSSPPAKAPTTMKKGPSPGSAAAPPSDMPSCRNCGRRFAQDRLQKHEEICVKTSKKKRKVFDPTKMRVKGTEAEAYLRNASKKNTKAPTVPKADWRRQHEDFIRSIRDAKAAQAHLAAGGKLSDLPPPPPMDTSHLTPCPHCGRKFNETAAERHIPRCKDTKHKPKPPPGQRGVASTSRGAKSSPLRR